VTAFQGDGLRRSEGPAKGRATVIGLEAATREGPGGRCSVYGRGARASAPARTAAANECSSAGPVPGCPCSFLCLAASLSTSAPTTPAMADGRDGPEDRSLGAVGGRGRPLPAPGGWG